MPVFGLRRIAKLETKFYRNVKSEDMAQMTGGFVAKALVDNSLTFLVSRKLVQKLFVLKPVCIVKIGEKSEVSINNKSTRNKVGFRRSCSVFTFGKKHGKIRTKLHEYAVGFLRKSISSK